jgi:hypothetical protein
MTGCKNKIWLMMLTAEPFSSDCTRRETLLGWNTYSCLKVEEEY